MIGHEGRHQLIQLVPALHVSALVRLRRLIGNEIQPHPRILLDPLPGFLRADHVALKQTGKGLRHRGAHLRVSRGIVRA